MNMAVRFVMLIVLQQIVAAASIEMVAATDTKGGELNPKTETLSIETMFMGRTSHFSWIGTHEFNEKDLHRASSAIPLKGLARLAETYFANHDGIPNVADHLVVRSSEGSSINGYHKEMKISIKKDNNQE